MTSIEEIDNRLSELILDTSHSLERVLKDHFAIETDTALREYIENFVILSAPQSQVDAILAYYENHSDLQSYPPSGIDQYYFRILKLGVSTFWFRLFDQMMERRW